jgi:hypothetical protein
MFNATFNNNSVRLWRLVLLVEETGVSGENHRHVASLFSTPGYERDSNSQLQW